MLYSLKYIGRPALEIESFFQNVVADILISILDISKYLEINVNRSPITQEIIQVYYVINMCVVRYRPLILHFLKYKHHYYYYDENNICNKSQVIKRSKKVTNHFGTPAIQVSSNFTKLVSKSISEHSNTRDWLEFFMCEGGVWAHPAAHAAENPPFPALQKQREGIYLNANYALLNALLLSHNQQSNVS